MSVPVATALVVAAALVWGLSGGLHDAPTLSAGAIAARALSPGAAVTVVGVAGFAGPLVAGTAVADTIGSFVTLEDLSALAALGTIAAGIAAAIGWNLITWRAGTPSSSTQGLVGGLIGATLVAGGPGDVCWGFAELARGRVEGVAKILAALLLSLVLGLAAGAAVQRLAAWSMRGAGAGWNRRIRRFQVLTVAGLAFAHGANEAQKCMGVVVLALLVGGTTERLEVPFWAVVASAATIPVAAMIGGWAIVRTLGYGIYPLRPLNAATAQVALFLHEGFARLRDEPETARRRALDVHRAERAVGQAYRAAVAEAFSQEWYGRALRAGGASAVPEVFEGLLAALRRREVYRHISNAADRLDAAGRVLTDIVVREA